MLLDVGSDTVCYSVNFSQTDGSIWKNRKGL